MGGQLRSIDAEQRLKKKIGQVDSSHLEKIKGCKDLAKLDASAEQILLSSDLLGDTRFAWVSDEGESETIYRGDSFFITISVIQEAMAIKPTF